MSEKANLFAIFPNRRLTWATPKLSKRGQSAKQKTKFLDFAYAEWSQTYQKLVQGERKSKLVCNFSEPPPNLDPVKVKQMRAEYQMKLVKNGIPLLALALRVPSEAKLIKS